MVVGIIPYVLALQSNDRLGVRINGAELEEAIRRIPEGELPLLAGPRLSLLRKADVPEADAATVGNDQKGGGHSMRSSAPVSGWPNSSRQACSIRRSALAQDAGVP